MTFVSAIILLLLVMDPFGGIPLFLAVLKCVEEKKRFKIVLRECGIAFFVLLAFLLFGQHVLRFLQLTQTSLGIASGIILFLISLRITFPTRQGVFGDLPAGEPFVVPLAVPLIAGPSAIATVLLLASRWPDQMAKWTMALVVATAVSTLTLSCGGIISRVLGERGLMAIERLMGLLLTAVAVEMLLNGIKDFIHHL
jgi:MarC family membrane protein